MKTLNLAKIRREMEKTLEPKRYEHTLSVAYTAANLAAVWGSTLYNMSYILPEMILTLVLLALPPVRKVMLRLKTLANQP